MPLVEAELHRLAHHYMSRERAGHTLQTTALGGGQHELVSQRCRTLGKLQYALANLVVGRWLRRVGSSTAASGLGLEPERQMGIKQTVGGLPVDSFARGRFNVRLWSMVSHR